MSRTHPLARWRRAEGLGTREAAERLQVTHPTIINWEAGTHFPRAKTLTRIAKIMSLDRATLVRQWREWQAKQRQNR